MTTTALEREFFHYFFHLSELQKKTMLEMMKAFLQQQQDIESKNITAIEQYNREIDEAMKRIDDGQYTTLVDLEREMKKW